MNSISYIGSQVDSLWSSQRPRADSDSDPKHEVRVENTSIWHLIWSLLLFRWSHVALILSRSYRSESSYSAQVYAPDKAKQTEKRRKSRLKGSSELLKRPLHLRDYRKKTLVLDLDETLMHSMTRKSTGSSAQMVEVDLGKMSCIYYVEKRPFCDQFLSMVREWYDLVVFTASVKSYADPMIDILDQGRNLFKRRFYRSDCISTSEGYIKDLTLVSPDLGRVLLVDNSVISFERQECNGIGVEGWISDPSDTCLLQLLPLLDALRFTTDVRSILCLQYGEKYFKHKDSFALE